MTEQNAAPKQEEVASSWFQLGLIFVLIVFIINTITYTSSDLSVEQQDQKSTESGTTGMIILMLTGVGLIFGINGVQDYFSNDPQGIAFAKEFQLDTMKFLVTPIPFTEQKLRYISGPSRPPSGAAHMVLGNKAKIRKSYNDDYDYSYDHYRESVAEQQAYEARKWERYNREREKQQQQNKTN